MTGGLDLAVTTTSLLLSLLDVEQQIMTGSPHFNSFSGQDANKIIRWPGLCLSSQVPHCYIAGG